MNRTRVSLGIFIFVAFSLPILAEAAWWNPLDWFYGQKSPIQQEAATNTGLNNSSTTIAALESENENLRKQISKLLAATSQCKLSSAQAAVAKSAATAITTPPPTQVSSTPPAVDTTTDSTRARALRVELATTDKLDLDADRLYNAWATTKSEEDRDALLSFLANSKKKDGSIFFPKNLFNPSSVFTQWVASDLKITGLVGFMHGQISTYRADLKIELAQYPASESPAK